MSPEIAIKLLLETTHNTPTPPAGTPGQDNLSLEEGQISPGALEAAFFQIWNHFWVFQGIMFFVFDFGSKRQLKLRLVASQNPSKTHPKATQNPCAKNITIFVIFLFIFVSCS